MHNYALVAYLCTGKSARQYCTTTSATAADLYTHWRYKHQQQKQQQRYTQQQKMLAVVNSYTHFNRTARPTQLQVVTQETKRTAPEGQ